MKKNEIIHARSYERGFQDGMERAAKSIEASLIPKNTADIMAAYIRGLASIYLLSPE